LNTMDQYARSRRLCSHYKTAKTASIRRGKQLASSMRTRARLSDNVLHWTARGGAAEASEASTGDGREHGRLARTHAKLRRGDGTDGHGTPTRNPGICHQIIGTYPIYSQPLATEFVRLQVAGDSLKIYTKCLLGETCHNTR